MGVSNRPDFPGYTKVVTKAPVKNPTKVVPKEQKVQSHQGLLGEYIFIRVKYISVMV